MSQYLNLTWDQFAEDTKGLGSKLATLDKQWTTVVAIARGGLVPAAIISHMFPTRRIETICITSYDDDTFQQTDLEVLTEYRSHSDDVLVIDDLADSGQTLRLVRTMLPHAHFACVYAKPRGIPATDSFFKEVSHDTWLVFPWEPAVEDQSSVDFSAAKKAL